MRKAALSRGQIRIPMTRGKVAPALTMAGKNLDHESVVALRRPKMQTDG